jgi:glycosyltransferase involved in cell wall biosynthesis
MRVVLVCCVFPPEPVVSGRACHDLAVRLVDEGHQVTVVTSFPRRPVGQFSRSDRAAIPWIEEAGYRVVRTTSWCAPGQTAGEKLIENLSFGLSSALWVARLQADVVFANTWPIFAGGMLAAVCRLGGVPLVLNVQDVHPEAACAAGKLARGGLAERWLRRLDARVARGATKLVPISNGFARIYREERGVPADRIEVIPNWGDDEAVVPRPKWGAVRRSWGVTDDTFITLYAGNIGEVAGVDTLIEAATLLRHEPGLLFVIAGDGSRRRAYERLVGARGLGNVRFHYPLTEQEFCDVQGAADLMALPTCAAGAMSSVPSKLISYMLSQRGVLAAVDADSETARVIQEADCGVCVPPESPPALAAAVLDLRRQASRLASMGVRARQYAQREFARDVCVGKWVELLREVAVGGRGEGSRQVVAAWDGGPGLGVGPQPDPRASDQRASDQRASAA